MPSFEKCGQVTIAVNQNMTNLVSEHYTFDLAEGGVRSCEMLVPRLSGAVIK